MTVAGRSTAVPLRQPRFRPVPQEQAGTWTLRDRVREAIRDWIGDVWACKRMLAVAAVFVAVGLAADYYCGSYVHVTAGAKVPDLLLDKIPPVDLSFLFVYGYMVLLMVLFLYPAFFRVRMVHVVAIQFSVLLMLRSVFMIFTHLETPAGSVAVSFPGLFENLYFENDMFFSGHTAMPFIGFYVFRRSPLRYFFLVGALVMGIVVLAMHLHYSIDVFAAFFMTYCSYKMGQRLLRKLDPMHLA
jgi:hypothetical protein